MHPIRRIADSTVRRLSLYLRFLDEFEGQGATTVSSDALATRVGTTAAQVRKDLSFFGSFGKRGTGYQVAELASRLRRILGLGRRYRLILIGAGKIGSALVQYPGFQERGFDIVAIFDSDPAKIGSRWNGLVVKSMNRLGDEVSCLKPDIAVIATPAGVAQAIADQLADLGVRAILNFAPATLSGDGDTIIRSVNLALELESLSFALTNR